MSLITSHRWPFFDIVKIMSRASGRRTLWEPPYCVVILESVTDSAHSFRSVTNLGFSTQELVPQLRETRPTLLIVQSESFSTEREACIMTGLDSARIVFLNSPLEKIYESMTTLQLPGTVQELVDFVAKRSGAVLCEEF
ncbi:hypothetical protein C8R43DRAFT_1140053 [Mycena crocata]|nr:hypothetical protein C8R43DRAFT_1140053 [Mycena crocata]